MTKLALVVGCGAAGVGVVGGVAGRVRGDVVVNTYGAGGAFDPGTYIEISGFGSFQYGWAFTSGVSGGLTQLSAPVYRAFPGSTALTFELFSRDAGGLPGVVLGSWGATVGTLQDAGGAPVVLALDGSVPVQAGVGYFLVVAGAAAQDRVRWYGDAAAAMGTDVLFTAGHWQVNTTHREGALRLESGVPGVGVGVGMVVGVGVLGLGRRRRSVG